MVLYIVVTEEFIKIEYVNFVFYSHSLAVKKTWWKNIYVQKAFYLPELVKLH